MFTNEWIDLKIHINISEIILNENNVVKVGRNFTFIGVKNSGRKLFRSIRCVYSKQI